MKRRDIDNLANLYCESREIIVEAFWDKLTKSKRPQLQQSVETTATQPEEPKQSHHFYADQPVSVDVPEGQQVQLYQKGRSAGYDKLADKTVHGPKSLGMGMISQLKGKVAVVEFSTNETSRATASGSREVTLYGDIPTDWIEPMSFT